MSDQVIPKGLSVVSWVWYDTLHFFSGYIGTAHLELFNRAVGLADPPKYDIVTPEISNLRLPKQWAARGQVFVPRYYTVTTNIPRLWLKAFVVELRADNYSQEEMPLDLALEKGKRLFEESERLISSQRVSIHLKPWREISCPEPLYLRFEVNGALFYPIDEEQPQLFVHVPDQL